MTLLLLSLRCNFFLPDPSIVGSCSKRMLSELLYFFDECLWRKEATCFNKRTIGSALRARYVSANARKTSRQNEKRTKFQSWTKLSFHIVEINVISRKGYLEYTLIFSFFLSFFFSKRILVAGETACSNEDICASSPLADSFSRLLVRRTDKVESIDSSSFHLRIHLNPHEIDQHLQLDTSNYLGIIETTGIATTSPFIKLT